MGSAAAFGSSPQPARRPGNENCDPWSRHGLPGLEPKRGAPATHAAASGWRRGGATEGAPAVAQPTCDARAQLQAALDAELEAAARDTMLAQCHALLSLEDPECLPHDPLFDVLPAPGASRRSPPKREQVVAALQAAAQDAAALVNASGAGLVADSSLLASTLLPGMAPPTCGRNKRSADVPAPATQLQLERGRAPGCAPAATAAVKPAWPALPTAAAATPGAATPAPATAQAAGKRQRMLLLTAARGTVATPGCGATPGSGVGSNSRVPAKAVRRVARDLSFTPAPAPQQLGSTGTPCTAGSASRCSGTLHESPSRHSAVLQPFSLLRSPGTSAQLVDLNARIQAAAAADLRYERRPGVAPSASCAPCAPAAAAGVPQPLHRALRSIRLC